MSNITLVTGFAGSGKSRYCNNLNCKHLLSHDDWAKNLRYGNLHVQSFIRSLLKIDTLNSRNIVDKLLDDPAKHKFYNAFFKMKFAEEIITLSSDTVVEIPYLDNNIKILKDIKDIEIVMIDRDIKHVEQSLEERSWSTHRIAETIRLQKQCFDKYSDIVDTVIYN